MSGKNLSALGIGGKSVFSLGLLTLPALTMAGTGIDSDIAWGPVYQTYDPASSYESYSDSYTNIYGGTASVDAYADAMNRQLGARSTALSGYGDTAGGSIGARFSGRIDIDASGIDTTYNPLLELRLELRLKGSLVAGSLIGNELGFEGLTNSTNMEAGFILYEGATPLQYNPGEISGLIQDIRSANFPDHPSLMNFYAESSIHRENLGDGNERLSYGWTYEANADEVSIYQGDWPAPITRPLDAQPFNLDFDTGLLTMDILAPIQETLWIEGALQTMVYVEDSASATADFMDSFSVNITSLTPGVTLTYSPDTTVVPLPAAAWLFGSGLLLLLRIGKRD
ncbi:MAG TPA: hypothetical protein ENI90_01975 [Methylothermaceae bacterium]|nr:hypothetical protein [Methylothermaceae bacterium]